MTWPGIGIDPSAPGIQEDRDQARHAGRSDLGEGQLRFHLRQNRKPLERGEGCSSLLVSPSHPIPRPRFMCPRALRRSHGKRQARRPCRGELNFCDGKKARPCTKSPPANTGFRKRGRSETMLGWHILCKIGRGTLPRTTGARVRNPTPGAACTHNFVCAAHEEEQPHESRHRRGSGRLPYMAFPGPGHGKGRSSGHCQCRRAQQFGQMRASGTHYSKSGQVPFVVGVDGVGRLDDGRRVYFMLPERGSVAWQRKPSCSLPDAFRCRTDWMM